jgi:hypothetical protein
MYLTRIISDIYETSFGRRFYPVFLAVYGRQEGVIEANPISRRGVLDRELREI